MKNFSAVLNLRASKAAIYRIFLDLDEVAGRSSGFLGNVVCNCGGDYETGIFYPDVI